MVQRTVFGPVAGSFTGTGASGAVAARGRVNVFVATEGNGDVEIQRSFDDGASWATVSKNADGAAAKYDTSSAGFNGYVEETEMGVLYRLACTRFSSGPIAYRISG